MPQAKSSTLLLLLPQVWYSGPSVWLEIDLGKIKDK